MTPAPAIDDAAIRRLVEAFYGRARLDPVIGPVFETAIHDWPAHMDRLVDFWSSVMLSTGRYKGNPFGAHRPLPLEPEMFDRWLGLWRQTAREVFEPEPAALFIDKADRIARSLSDGLFFRPLEKAG